MNESTDFKSEKEFVEYLILNAEHIATDFFGSQVDSVLKNQTIHARRFGANLPSIDIVMTLRNGRRIGIEVKNPKQGFHETSRAVSQLLSYGVLAEEAGNPFDELVLITSSKNNIGCRIVKRYNLPIKIFYIDRSIHGELR